MTEKLSVLTNCYISARKGDPTLFEFTESDGKFWVHLNGYAIAPLERTCVLLPKHSFFQRLLFNLLKRALA